MGFSNRLLSKQTGVVLLVAALVALAGCGGGGGPGAGGTDTTAADETTVAGDATTVAETTTTGTETDAGDQGDFLFDGDLVNVSANGTVTGPDGELLGNVSIVDDNQQGGDGLFDVNIYSNGTVVNEGGDVVGQVEVNETATGATNQTTTAAGTGNATNASALFGGEPVNVGANGTVTDASDEIVANVSILHDNQQGGDGFTDVTVYRNGTVVNETGDVVGDVEVNSVCPSVSEDGSGEFYFDGDLVDISGATGDVFFDNQDDTFVDVNILENQQNESGDFQDVRVATNGSVVNESGDVVGQVEFDQRCPSATAQNASQS